MLTARRGWYAIAGLLLLMLLYMGVSARPFVDYWLTPDQQGQRLENRRDHAAAAGRYLDPLRRGTAFYRAKDFESAAALFATVDSAEAAYNRGNALVMLGRYPEAMESYDRALAARPDWPEAGANRELARLRQARREAGGPGEGTGGKLGADEVVFGDEPDTGAGDQVQTEGGDTLGAAEAEALWMRRLQTSPADFLRARFSHQLMIQDEAPAP